MQTVTPEFTAATTARLRRINFGLLISFMKEIDPDTDFFTIGTSTIGGPDFIPGSNDTVSFFDYYNFEDYTDYVLDYSISQKIGDRPYGVIMAHADVTLSNHDQKFSPGSDPDIGDFVNLPKRPIKISQSFDGDYINLFTGFTDRPQHTIDDLKTKIHAFDALDYADNYESELGVLTNITTDELIQTLLEEMGFEADHYDLEPSIMNPIGIIDCRGKKVGDLFRQAVEAEQGLLFVSEAGVITFWNRQHLVNNPTSQWDFDFDNLMAFDYEPTPIINHVIVRSKPRVVKAKAKLWEISTKDSPEEIPAGAVDHEIVAEFKDDFGSVPVTSVDTPVYVTNGTGSSVYATNELADGSGDPLDTFITLDSVSLQGNRYVMKFTNTYSGPVFIRQLELFGTAARVVQEIEEERFDQDSIDKYGRNPNNSGKPIEIVNDLIDLPDNALALAFHLVETYKEPLVRVKGQAEEVPQLQFGDATTWTNDDTGIIHDMWIVGQVKSLSPPLMPKHELWAEERAAITYFTIGVSEIGGPDVLAP